MKLLQETYQAVENLRNVLGQLEGVEGSDTLAIYHALVPKFGEFLNQFTNADSDDVLLKYISEQYDLLVQKSLHDTISASKADKDRFVNRALLPVLSLSASWPSNHVQNETWWGRVFQTIIDQLTTSSEKETFDESNDAVNLISESLLGSNSFLISKFLESLSSLSVEDTATELYVEILLSTDVDLLRECISHCPSTGDVVRGALKVLVKKSDFKHRILSRITPDHALLFDTPVELIIEMINHHEALARSSSSQVQRFDFLPRLYQFIVSERMVSHLANIITANNLLTMVFEAMTPEAVIASQQLHEFRDMLQGLIKYMNATQLYYYFRKALVLACVLPPHRSLWLVKWARQLLERNPMILIPTIHLNPSLAQHINIDLNAQDSLAKLPQELPEASPDDSVLPLTSLRCCQNPCVELSILGRHSSAAVREASAAITKFLARSDTLEATTSRDDLDLSWYQIADGGLKRAMKRLEVATELFS